MALTFGSVSFGAPGVAFRRGSAAQYVVEEPSSESADPGIQDNPAEGVDGVGTVVGGFRGRAVGPFSTIYVAASGDACRTAFEGDRIVLEAAQVPDGFSVTQNNGTVYESCYLLRGGAKPVGGPHETEAGTWWMEVVWMFEQKRPTVVS